MPRCGNAEKPLTRSFSPVRGSLCDSLNWTRTNRPPVRKVADRACHRLTDHPSDLLEHRAPAPTVNHCHPVNDRERPGTAAVLSNGPRTDGLSARRGSHRAGRGSCPPDGPVRRGSRRARHDNLRSIHRRIGPWVAHANVVVGGTDAAHIDRAAVRRRGHGRERYFPQCRMDLFVHGCASWSARCCSEASGTT